MTFTTWLRRQTYRDDPVGDLARDYVGDTRRPRGGPSALRSHIRTVAPLGGFGALAALKVAAREWVVDEAREVAALRLLVRLHVADGPRTQGQLARTAAQVDSLELLLATGRVRRADGPRGRKTYYEVVS